MKAQRQSRQRAKQRGKQRADDPGPLEAGLGVRSSVPHKLHPTAGKILAASKRILQEHGYQGLTLQAISAEAGVNKSGVWYYFGGKQQLVLALLEEVTVTESHHFGAVPPPGATLEERVDLIVGSARQVQDRVRNFAAFYELLPEASRDAELREHLMTYYTGWYDWAAEVLAGPGGGEGEVDGGEGEADGGQSDDGGEGAEARARASRAFGQFASILLDGIFMQMVVAAPAFDLEAALQNARRALLHLGEAAPAPAALPR
jgi:AcrR family transcriptional regulator